MSVAHARRRWPRRSPSITGITTAVIAIFVLATAPALVDAPTVIVLYLAWVAATMVVIRIVPQSPGWILGRRMVRRGLVIAIVADCVGIVLSGSSSRRGNLSLLIILAVLDVLLGRATERVASAADPLVDERQEALRNRAHRIAYIVITVGMGSFALVAQAASLRSAAWVASLPDQGALIVAAQLLFVSPAMILAWLEPDRLAAESRPARGRPSVRIAIGMLAVAVLAPFAFAATLMLPGQTSATVSAQPSSADARCDYFEAHKWIGFGTGADIRISGEACWDGHQAFEDWGFNDSDCHSGSTTMSVDTTTECRRWTDAHGSMHFRYGASIQSTVLPFMKRNVVLTLVLDRNGRVVQFP